MSMFSQGIGLCVMRPCLFETYTAGKIYMVTQKIWLLSIVAFHLRRKALKVDASSTRLKVRIPNG